MWNLRLTLRLKQIKYPYSSVLQAHLLLSYQLAIENQKMVAYLVTSTENLIFVATTCSTLPDN